MKKVYAVVFDRQLKIDTKFFGNLIRAKKELEEIKRQVQRNLLKRFDTETDTSFSFHYGWEGHGGTWEIIEYPLEE